MTKKVRNSDSPTRIWFGGDDCVPIAVRSRPSTIRMRVKLVMHSSNAGRKDSEVSSTSVCTLSDQVWLPPGPGVLTRPGRPWVQAAIGTQSSPPNQILVGLSLFLTFFVMSPVFDKDYDEAYKPFSENKITAEKALEKGIAPFKSFMLKQTRENDLALFARLAKIPDMQGPEEVPLRILLPAFVISELKTAFQIGFTIFIPFLIIDLVVASVLMSMGMMMVPPASIALPFKLMLFVMADGWQLLIGALAQSFYL